MTAEGLSYTYWRCECGWFRDVSSLDKWRTEPLNHPAYGRTTNMSAVLRDIKNHDCTTYLETVTKWRQITGRTKLDADTENSTRRYTGPTESKTRRSNRTGGSTPTSSRK